MSDDDTKGIIMPAVIFNPPPEQLVAYYARHVYTLAEEAFHIQHINAQFTADPTGYHISRGTNELVANGKLVSWDITPHLRQIHRYVALFLYYVEKTNRQLSVWFLRLSTIF